MPAKAGIQEWQARGLLAAMQRRTGPRPAPGRRFGAQVGVNQSVFRGKHNEQGVAYQPHAIAWQCWASADEAGVSPTYVMIQPARRLG
jgi:hypothetical protein